MIIACLQPGLMQRPLVGGAGCISPIAYFFICAVLALACPAYLELSVFKFILMQRGAERNILFDALHAIVHHHSSTTHILDNNVTQTLHKCAVVSANLPVWRWPVESTVH